MKKTIFKNFEYMECDDFEAFLEEMAALGWHFKEWKLGLVFEKGTPSEEKYAVEVFIHGNEMDTRPEPNTEEFAEYCEEVGWKLIDAKRKFCIFKRCREDAVSITTLEERLENITEAAAKQRKERIVTFGIIAACQWFRLSQLDFEGFIFNNLRLLLFLAFNVGFVYQIIRYILFQVWIQKSGQKIQMGEPVYYGSGKLNDRAREMRKTLFSLLVIVMVAAGLWHYEQYWLIAGVVAIFVVDWILCAAVEIFRPSKIMHQAIQLSACFFFFTFMIVFAFMGAETEESAEVVQRGSIFGSVRYYESLNENPEEPAQEYVLYQSEYDWVLDRIWSEESRYLFIEDDCTAQWEAEIALQGIWPRYLVRYEDKILALYEKEDLTQKEIEEIKEKLELRKWK